MNSVAASVGLTITLLGSHLFCKGNRTTAKPSNDLIGCRARPEFHLQLAEDSDTILTVTRGFRPEPTESKVVGSLNDPAI